jgi:hypothetical protein
MDLEKQASQIAVTNGETNNTQSSTSKPSSFEFAWSDVSFSVQTKEGEKQILSNVAGCVEQGSHSPLILVLTVRQTIGLDGPQRMWKDDSA